MFCDSVFECVSDDENAVQADKDIGAIGREGGIAGVSALLSPREARGEYEEDAEGGGGGGTPLTVDGEFLANSRHAASVTESPYEAMHISLICNLSWQKKKKKRHGNFEMSASARTIWIIALGACVIRAW